MIHNPKRILLIERWSGWLAWFSLVSGIISLMVILFGFFTGQIYSHPYHVDFTVRLLRQSDTIVTYLQPLITTKVMFLLLQGISKATHFLRKYYAQISTAK
ncbi:MAG: hypothetical protein ABFS17_06360 [Chloroflexota bacterium]